MYRHHHHHISPQLSANNYALVFLSLPLHPLLYSSYSCFVAPFQRTLALLAQPTNQPTQLNPLNPPLTPPPPSVPPLFATFLIQLAHSTSSLTNQQGHLPTPTRSHTHSPLPPPFSAFPFSSFSLHFSSYIPFFDLFFVYCFCYNKYEQAHTILLLYQPFGTKETKQDISIDPTTNHQPSNHLQNKRKSISSYYYSSLSPSPPSPRSSFPWYDWTVLSGKMKQLGK